MSRPFAPRTVPSHPNVTVVRIRDDATVTTSIICSRPHHDGGGSNKTPETPTQHSVVVACHKCTSEKGMEMRG
jgi:hypothetical protein